MLLFAADENQALDEVPTWAAIKTPDAEEEPTAMVGGRAMDWMRKKTRARLSAHISFAASGVQREVLLEKKRYTIGFTDDCEIRLPGKPLLLKEVARLSYGGRWSIEPLTGLAGLKVNGERVKARREVHDGDEIAVKGTELVFHTALVE